MSPMRGLGGLTAMAGHWAHELFGSLLSAIAVPAESATPTPDPSYIAPNVDPNRVTPGLLGFLSFLFLIVACVVLFFSLRKQLSKIRFDPKALPGGVRAVPDYARTDAPRRTTPSSARPPRKAAPDAPSAESGAGAGTGAGGADRPSAGSRDDDPGSAGTDLGVTGR